MSMTAARAARLVLDDFGADAGLKVYTVWADASRFAVDVSAAENPQDYDGMGLVLVDNSTGQITHMGSWEDPAPVLAAMHEVPFQD